MGRNIAAFGVGLLATIATLGYSAASQRSALSSAACAGAPLSTREERDQARRDGYVIHAVYQCIDKNSFIAVNRQRAEQREAQAKVAARAPSTNDIQTLAEARRGFETKVSVHAKQFVQLRDPPLNLFVPSYYATANKLLPAYVTPDPQDGLRHAAIIWLSDGDTNSLQEFWNSQNSAAVEKFRAAGIVVMFAVLRGGNNDNSGREMFFGEVNDVLAAAEHLASIGYVNPDRIYLAGHGTGGTLALLTAEMSARFADVFAFGPIVEVDRYATGAMRVDFDGQDPRERQLRSPIHWLHGIATPTYVIEGRNLPENGSDAEAICAKSTNPKLHCIMVDGADHVSVVEKVSTVIAARLSVRDQMEFNLRADEFTNDRFAQLQN